MDIRVPMDPITGAFGLSVTVTPPDQGAVQTYGIWLSSLFEEPPVGKDLSRRDPRRVMALLTADVGDLPRGSLVVAPEMKGQAAKNWYVDGVEKAETDHLRVVLVPEHL